VLVEARKRDAKGFPLRRLERAQEMLTDSGCMDRAGLGDPGSSRICNAYLDAALGERPSRDEPSLFHPGEVVRNTAPVPAQRLRQLALAEGSAPDLDHAGKDAEVRVREPRRRQDIGSDAGANTLGRLLPRHPERRLLSRELRHTSILRDVLTYQRQHARLLS